MGTNHPAGIVEGEPGIFPDPIARLLRAQGSAIRALASRRRRRRRVLRLVPITGDALEAERVGDHSLLGQILGCAVEAWPPEGGEWDAAAVEFFAGLLADPGFNCTWGPSYVLTDGVLVATGGFLGPPHDGEVEIGYSVCAAHRRRGIASWIVAELCALARLNGCHTVLARTSPDNEASIACLERAGFHRAGLKDGLFVYRRPA